MLIDHAEHKCARCGFKTATAGLIQCPQCLGIACFAPVGGEESGELVITKLSKVKRMKVERLRLEHDVLDWFFNGGLVKTCAYYFTGPPGAGKSRWLLQAAQFFENPLYLSGEESAAVLKLRQHEMGLELSNLSVAETQDMEAVAKRITNEFDAVLLDSAHRFSTRDVSGAVGTPLMVESVIRLATDIARKLEQVWVIVGHVNADGQQSGKVANVHDVDAHVVIEVPDPSSTRRILSFNGKHRHGPTERRVSCEMTGHGLDNFERVKDDAEKAGESPEKVERSSHGRSVRQGVGSRKEEEAPKEAVAQEELRAGDDDAASSEKEIESTPDARAEQAHGSISQTRLEVEGAPAPRPAKKTVRAAVRASVDVPLDKGRAPVDGAFSAEKRKKVRRGRSPK